MPLRFVQLVALGVERGRISAYCPSHSAELQYAINQDIRALNEDLGLGIPAAGIATMYLWPEAAGEPAVNPNNDFVRSQTFRLAAEQIESRKVAGAIAELGVYQGDQAAMLNRLLPKRKLYLFDTFEGFSEKDLPTESSAGFSRAIVGDFKDTSVSLVMSKMVAPDVVEVHKGYFPETAAGVVDAFALVSLDVDLYEPTLAGLEWFYPRLSQGGLIFVHDYNNRRYLGVRAAVDKFLAQSNARTFPLADFAGSIAILK